MDPSLLGKPIPVPTNRKQPRGISQRLILVIGILAVAVIVALFLLLNSGDKTGELQQRLSARNATTLKILADGKKNLTGDEISKLNSELTLVLTGHVPKVEAALKLAGMKKIEKSITTAEADTETFTTLTSAKLNARYDTTYQGVLAQKLESLRGLLRELHDKTRSSSLKTALNDEYKVVSLYLKQVEALEN